MIEKYLPNTMAAALEWADKWPDGPTGDCINPKVLAAAYRSSQTNLADEKRQALEWKKAAGEALAAKERFIVSLKEMTALKDKAQAETNNIKLELLKLKNKKAIPNAEKILLQARIKELEVSVIKADGNCIDLIEAKEKLKAIESENASLKEKLERLKFAFENSPVCSCTIYPSTKRGGEL